MEGYGLFHQGETETKINKGKQYGAYAAFMFSKDTPVKQKLKMIRKGVSHLVKKMEKCETCEPDISTILFIVREGEHACKDDKGETYHAWVMTVSVKFIGRGNMND